MIECCNARWDDSRLENCPRCEKLLKAGSRPASCSLRELIEDEMRDLWQWGYDREPREESVQPRLDAIMRIIEANAKEQERES